MFITITLALDAIGHWLFHCPSCNLLQETETITDLHLDGCTHANVPLTTARYQYADGAWRPPAWTP